MEANSKTEPRRNKRGTRAENRESEIYKQDADKKPSAPKPPLSSDAQNMNIKASNIRVKKPSTLQELKGENARLRKALETESRERKVMEKVLQGNEQASRELAETALRQAQELTLLDKVRTTIAAKLDMPALLRSVVESIAEVYGYTHVSIYMVEGGELVLQHQVGYKQVIERIAVNKGISGKVVRTGLPILIEDVSKHPDFLEASKNLKSEITVPLMDNNLVAGTLSVESVNKLTASDLKILVALSADVGVAIGRAQLYEDIQRRNRTLSALQESTLAIMRHLDLQEAMQTILAQAAQLMDTSDGYIYLLQSDGALQMATGIGIYPKFIGTKIKPGEGLAGKVWQRAHPLNVNDYQHWEGRSTQFEDLPFRAVTGVPLIRNSRVAGVLGLSHTVPERTFSEEDVEFLSRFAQLASIALENADLYAQVSEELGERKQAEEALRVSRSQLESVFNSTMDGIITIDEDQRIVFFNPAAEIIFKYPAGKALGQPMDQFIPEHSRQKHLSLVHSFGKSGTTQRSMHGAALTFSCLRADGETFPADISISQIEVDGRKLYTAFIRDITERKRSEEALRVSEQKYKTLFDNAPIQFFTKDLELHYTSSNLENQKYWQKEKIGYTDLELAEDSNARDANVRDQQVLESGQQITYEQTIITDIGTRTLLTRKVPIYDIEGNINGLMGAAIDITERKQAEDDLRKAEVKYRTLAEQIPAIVYIAAPNQHIGVTYISPQIELLGFTQEEWVADHELWWRQVHPDDQAKVLEDIEQIRRSAEKYRLEYRLRTRDGDIRWFFDEVKDIVDDDGNILFRQGFMLDITDRKQADEALRVSQERLQLFFNQSLDGFFFSMLDEPVEWNDSTDKQGLLDYVMAHQHITEANDAMIKQYGATRDNFIGRTPSDFFAHDLEQGRRFRMALFDAGHLHLETEERRDDGRPIWIEGDYVCLYNSLERITGFFGIQRDITERKKGEDELKRHIQNTLTMYELSQSIHTSLNLDLVYQETHLAVQKLMPCDAFLIALLDDKNQQIDDVFIWDQGKRWESKRHRFGEGLTSYIISTAKPLFVNQWTEAHTEMTRTVQLGNTEQDTSSVLAVPLFALDGSCFGMMTAQAYPSNAYAPEHEHLLITLANQVSKAIENANLFVEVQQELAERNRTEQALRASEERYRTLFGGMLDGVYQSTHDGKFVDVNPAMVKLFGYSSREEMLSIDIKKDLYFSPGERNSLFLDTGQEKVDEFRMKRKDGSEIWVEDHGRYIHDENGNVIYHEGILRDITERKLAEDALKRSEAFTKSIIDNEPECVKIVAANGILQYMNPAGLAMIEAESLEPLIGKSVYPIIAQKDREAFIELTEKVLKGEQGTLQFEVIGLKGTRRWLDTHAVPLYDENGKVTALLGLTRDITERQRAVEAVREAEEKYRSIFENAVEGIYQSTPNGRFYTVNPAFASMLGFSSPQEMMDSITDIAHQVYNETDRRHDFIQQLEEQGSISGFEYQMRRKDGRLIWVTENARLVRDADGRVLYYEGILEDITARKQNEQRIDNQLKQLNALHAIDNAINSNFDLRTTLEVLLREVIAQLHADATSVLLFNKDTHTLDYTAGRGFLSKATQHTKLSVGEGYAGRVILDRKTIHIPDLTKTENNRLTDALNLAGENFVAYVGYPLIAKGQVVGVLEIFQRAPLAPDPDWFDFLSMIVDQAAIAIDNAQLFENLQRSNFDLTLAYDATIEGWSRALDLRDRETEGHTQRVTNLTIKLARQMGIPDADILHIRRGALLHDIGKMGIPDSILHKPDKLTPEEWDIMHQHTNYAYQMLTPIKYLKPALDIPRCHHEKWDGSGYPDGLKGEQIPIAARIFAVVDVWDALTSDRSYRDAWSREKVIEYIRAESGKQFDPKVVETFLSFILNEAQ